MCCNVARNKGVVGFKKGLDHPRNVQYTQGIVRACAAGWARAHATTVEVYDTRPAALSGTTRQTLIDHLHTEGRGH